MISRLRALGVVLVGASCATVVFALPSSAADAVAPPKLDSVVQLRSAPARRHTAVRALRVRPVRAGSRVRVSCSGRGCPFAVRARSVRRTVRSLSLTSLVRRARLRPRATLEVRVTKPQTIGIVARYRFRAGASPRVTMLCLAPGARRPARCSSKRKTTATTNEQTATTATSTAPDPPAVERLRFGVYPWGGVGCVQQCAPSVPENANKSMAAVKELKGAQPFVVHLYGEYNGVSNGSVDALVSEASWWSSNGVQVSAVLRYRPSDAGKAAGYAAWVRTQTRRLAALPGTVAIQIANEPNNDAPDAGDGSYPGIVDAIADGVPAARAEVVAAGRGDIQIGFNWAAGSTPTATEPLWTALRQAGGSAFTQAVGFVGVNVYPGTWSPPLAATAPTTAQIDAAVRSTLSAVRNKHMVAAGVASASIVITETGYPTTAARSATTQDTVLRAIVAAADATKSTYGVTDVRWFSLRDGNTASGQLENGYGLLRDDYTPKPAFTTLRAIVAGIGA